MVFNCDGQYALNDTASGQGVINEVDCLFANYINVSNTVYAAHSQLARVKDPASGGDPNAPSFANATFEKLYAGSITVVPVTAPVELELNDYFAGGPGQIHICGLNDPFTLYP